ncbi:bacteriocin [Staphylococcus felis]|nr:bacteriocin [Staphylococcus felis]UXR86655.1 bacteriocin [Staphylococcus felis]
MKTLNEQQLKTVNGGGTCAPDGEDSFMCDVGQGAKKAWNWIRDKF